MSNLLPECKEVAEGSTSSTISDRDINIKLIGNKPLIWTAEEWLKLQKLRIIGTLIGVSANLPRQISKNGLPMLLMSEEVSLILERNIGKIYTYKKVDNFTYNKFKVDYDAYFSKNKEEQCEAFKDICRKQVIDKLDIIIEGKKRKLQDQQSSEKMCEAKFDKDSIIESEVERKLKSATSSYVIQIPTSSVFIKNEDLEHVEWKYPETPKEKIRYKVFKDLYDKGYSITPGSKFGGDFLVYPGNRFFSGFIQ